jgi:hypothetical protein
MLVIVCVAAFPGIATWLLDRLLNQGASGREGRE